MRLGEGNLNGYTSGNVELCENENFYISFLPENVKKTDSTDKCYINKEHFLYKISGNVVYIHKKEWIIDCGILIYNSDLPKGVSLGDYVECEAKLLANNFFSYKQYEPHDKHRFCPDLKYSFKVNHIAVCDIFVSYDEDSGEKESIFHEEFLNLEDGVFCFHSFDEDHIQIDCVLKSTSPLKWSEDRPFKSDFKIYLGAEQDSQLNQELVYCKYEGSAIHHLKDRDVSEMHLHYNLKSDCYNNAYIALEWIEKEVVKSNYFPPKIVYQPTRYINSKVKNSISRINELASANLVSIYKTLLDEGFSYNICERVRFAESTHLPEGLANYMLDDPARIVIIALAKNPSLSHSVQYKLSKLSNEPYVLHALARNESLTTSLMHKFSDSDDKMLQKSLAENKNLLPELKLKLNFA
ncbi:hypothetical protein [Endozoicomonas lisbonensis]|uniref:DUF4116 domain-containing protein n=1 Tax=Endozoicomonas lisbonensis TaxID=3120522 RepID=A0ABV2SMC1_9GAMM